MNGLRREWAERIAVQYESDSVDAIEEGITRGLLIAEGIALKRYAEWRAKSRGWGEADADAYQRHAFAHSEEASDFISALRSLARDNGSRPEGEDSRSAAECEARQSGRSEAKASPKHPLPGPIGE